MPTSAFGKTSKASSPYWTFMSRWRISACADSLVSTSVTVMRTSGLSSRCFVTSSFARLMSTFTVNWNAGTVHASVSRRAIVLRIFESGRDSTSPDGTGACNRLLLATVSGSACARSTSSATIRPSGPVPLICARSTPRSRAIRRAGGFRLDLLRHLVGVELVERLAFLDRLALRFEPLHDRPGLHALAEPRQLDFGCHQFFLFTLRKIA